MNNKKFIWILLRGGMDGLSFLPPYGLDEYYSLRPHVSIPKNKLIKINDKFGMYPSLKNGIYKLFENGQMLLFPQSGQHENSKNHLSSQKTMEIGSYIPDINSGFLNRMAQAIPYSNPYCFSNELPTVFKGDLLVNNISIENYKSSITQQNQHNLFNKFKQNDFHNFFKKIVLHKKIMNQLHENYPNFEKINYAEKIGIFIREANIDISFIDTGHNWDTHSLFNPGVIHGTESHNFDKHSIDVSNDGRLFFLFNMLESTLLSLKSGLKEEWDNTVIAINTEFGRSHNENGSQGFDHGHGSLMIVTGGAIKESKIIGDIFSLNPEHSFEEKHLHVTHEYKEVLISLFKTYFLLNEYTINKIFLIDKNL